MRGILLFIIIEASSVEFEPFSIDFRLVWACCHAIFRVTSWLPAQAQDVLIAIVIIIAIGLVPLAGVFIFIILVPSALASLGGVIAVCAIAFAHGEDLGRGTRTPYNHSFAAHLRIDGTSPCPCKHVGL